MTSIQERLQLKRVPLDKWSVREQLCLASAVACSGDQNWMSVSRSLKMLCGGNRPSDWFSQKSCAAQYGKLLENVETPKRKKRTEKDNGQTPVETPSESILRKLTHERLTELNNLIQAEQKEYTKTKDEILAIQSNDADETKYREVWSQIELEKKQREKEQLQHAQWLKEREERKIELERAWRPNLHLYQQNSPNQSPAKPATLNIKAKPEDMDVDDANTRQGTSPLLTSLLKSPSPAPNPGSSILHTPNTSTSSRVIAPTITNLLTGTNSPHISTPTTTQCGTYSSPQQVQQQLSAPPSYDQSTSAGAVVQTPSQAAPTLSMLLENKNKEQQKIQTTAGRSDIHQQQQQQQQQHSHLPDVNEMAGGKDLFASTEESTGTGDNSPIKDEDQQLMEVFKGLIPDNIDELANILTENSAIILNSDLLEEESILENVQSLMSEHDDNIEDGNSELSTQDFNQIVSEGFQSITTTSTNQPAENECSTVELDKSTADSQLESFKNRMMNENVSTIDDAPSSEPIIIKDDDQSDFSNDAPLSELLHTTKSKEDKLKIIPDEVKKEDTDSVEHIVELKNEEPDVFESDSNDDKCLESIKREIHQLSGLKENSDNSNEGSENEPNDANKDVVMEEKKLENDFAVEVETVTADMVKEECQEMEIEQKPIVVITTNTENNKDADIVEIVEIKDDKSDDEKQETCIIIEETDDANSEVTVSDEVKTEIVNIKDDDEEEAETANQTESKNRKLSTDDECFEDAKETAEQLIKKEEQEVIIEPKSLEQTITIIDTDDDSPIEVIKEDKVGKTKRDYSRRKHESSSTEKRNEETVPLDENKASIAARLKLKDRDRSESPMVEDDETKAKRRYSSTPNIDSFPNSPASSDDRDYRAWKKSILLVYNRLLNHKSSSIFLKPNTEDQAPEYKNSILKPIDLQTIKRNIESGSTRTTAEFQRDIMLMCYNVIMVNSHNHPTSIMAKELLNEIETILETFKKEQEKSTPNVSIASSTISAVKLGRSRKSRGLNN